MFDAHCHVSESEKYVGCDEGTILLMMTSRKEEWAKLVNFEARHIRAFGVHPWYSAAHDWSVDGSILENHLKLKNAMVGEIGLDGIATDSITGSKFPMEVQLYWFEKQMDLAAKWQRPVSIHCVKAAGLMLKHFIRLDKACEAFRKIHSNDNSVILPAPPAIMMHSFSCSSEILNSLIKLPQIGDRFYFSYSELVNSRSPKTLNRIRATPKDRILVESDVSDMELIDNSMKKSIELICISNGWSRERVIQQTCINTLRFLGTYI